MNIFYSDNINDEFIFLNKLEFNHCINVMRCTIGDLVNVVDGLGNLFKCEMIEIGKKECKLKILEEIKEYNSNDYYITFSSDSSMPDAGLPYFDYNGYNFLYSEIDYYKTYNYNHTIRVFSQYKSSFGDSGDDNKSLPLYLMSTYGGSNYS